MAAERDRGKRGGRGWFMGGCYGGRGGGGGGGGALISEVEETKLRGKR